MEKVAPNSKFAAYSAEVIWQSKIEGPLRTHIGTITQINITPLRLCFNSFSVNLLILTSKGLSNFLFQSKNFLKPILQQQLHMSLMSFCPLLVMVKVYASIEVRHFISEKLDLLSHSLSYTRFSLSPFFHYTILQQEQHAHSCRGPQNMLSCIHITNI